MLQHQLDVYSKRDRLIDKFRQALDGRNPIKAPRSMTYKTVAWHTRRLNAILNEKTSRYRPTPEIKVIPVGKDGRVSKPIRNKAERLEKGANGMFYQLERQGAESVWQNIVWDLHVADAACEKWLRSPSTWWPKLVPYLEEDEEEGAEPRDVLERVHGDSYEKIRESYKQEQGLPITRFWVPIERFYPVFDRGFLTEGFELSERSLRSLMNNPLFDTSSLSGYAQRGDGGLGQSVVILEYSNDTYHAYYALGPSTNSRQAWPRITSSLSLTMGTPVLLHSYEHGLGRPVYNYIIGRGGGWVSGDSRQEGVMEALLDKNQQADELFSQKATFLRNTMWPTRAAYFDREARGSDDNPPAPPKIEEGGIISMFKGEDIKNLTMNIPDFQFADRLSEQIIGDMNALAGSPVLYGERQPGVNTGYHQQIQQNQAKHLDSQIENALSRGAIGGVELAFLHIRAMGEKCYVFSAEKGRSGKMDGEYLCIDPKDIDPLPQLAAKVIDPQPQDLMIAAQTALQLTQMRPGHNTPLLDDARARQDILGFQDPEDIERSITEQTLREQLRLNPVIAQDMAQRLGLELAKRQSATLSPEEAASASPAFQQAAAEMNQSGEAAAVGGVQPANLAAQIDGRRMAESRTRDGAGTGGILQGVGGGLPTGAPQPMQVMGRTAQVMQGSQLG